MKDQARPTPRGQPGSAQPVSLRCLGQPFPEPGGHRRHRQQIHEAAGSARQRLVADRRHPQPQADASLRGGAALRLSNNAQERFRRPRREV